MRTRPRPGTYVLLFTLPHPVTCPIGIRRAMQFPKDSYIYVGSAKNGLDQRITRHLRTTKKYHWHIDYLLPYASTIQAYYTTDPAVTECRLAAAFLQHHDPVPDFGNSDCACPTHLIHGPATSLTATIHTLTLTAYEPENLLTNHGLRHP